MGDPEAADFVFGQTDRIRVVGLDVTHKCRIPATQLDVLRTSQGKFGPFLFNALQFYLKYHRWDLILGLSLPDKLCDSCYLDRAVHQWTQGFRFYPESIVCTIAKFQKPSNEAGETPQLLGVKMSAG